MGSRGPIGQTAKHHKLRGSKSKTKPAASVDGAPVMPIKLKGKAAAKWLEVLPKLLEQNRISPLDGDLLAVYCVTWARWCDDIEEAEKSGYDQLSSTGFIAPKPVAGRIRNARQDLLAYSSRLGLDLPSRQRTPAPPKPKTEVDPLTALMNE